MLATRLAATSWSSGITADATAASTTGPAASPVATSTIGPSTAYEECPPLPKRGRMGAQDAAAADVPMSSSVYWEMGLAAPTTGPTATPSRSGKSMSTGALPQMRLVSIAESSNSAATREDSFVDAMSGPCARSNGKGTDPVLFGPCTFCRGLHKAP